MLDSNGSVGKIGILITNGTTHSADKWAQGISEQLIPILPNISQNGIVKVIEARQKLLLLITDNKE